MKKSIKIAALILIITLNGCANNQETSTEGADVNKHEKINYVEFPAKDIEATKTFFTTVFGWSFVDYGPEYAAFSNAGLEGGFYKADLSSSTDNGSALIVLYSNKLEETLSKIEQTGGKIVKPIFSFPGGRRFHFADPNGNEYAVWSE
jgi:predicted enzyme related to lactoylglutathione lyase